MKALITGSAGFVGQHLKDYLLTHEWEIYDFNYRDGLDVTQYEHLRAVLDIERPDVIFHLAAQAYVPESFTNPQRAFHINTLGTVNLLEAVRQLGLKSTVHLAGTSEEYGDSAYADGPVDELTLPTPQSPYAISKLAMDYLGQLYAKAYGLHVVVTRTFNHTGPGRGEMYAESSWAKQIAQAENGGRKVVQHGNLDSVRNYTDVRDVVRAYKLATKLPSGVYNICSDKNVPMKDVLQTLVKHAKVPVKLEENAALTRPSDFSFKEPSCERFTTLTGWKPEISFDKTLKDILKYWREKVQ